MAFVIGDRVLETTTSTGVGPLLTLAGAVSGYRAFSTVATANGDTFYYQIAGSTEWEVGLGTRVSATTFNRTTIYASSNGGAAVGFSGGTKEVWMDAAAEQLRCTMNLNGHPAIINGSLLASVAGNALTLAVRNAAGAVPSNTDPVFLMFQTASGGTTVVRIAAALSITVSSGSTLGFIANEPGRVWLAVLLNAGVAELVVRNCTQHFGVGSGNSVIGFGNGVISTTALAGAGADDSALVSYSTSARSGVPFFILGFFDWDDTPLVTAGAWATLPNKTVMMGVGVPLPGALIQTIVNASFSQIDSASATYVNVVGTTITRQSKINSVMCTAGGGAVQTTTASTQAGIRIFNTTQTYATDAQQVTQQTSGAFTTWWPVFIFHFDFPSTVLANTYNVQVARLAGTVNASYPVSGAGAAWIKLEEFMG